MPYDSNGNYTLPTVYQAKPATTIRTEQHNTPLEDVASALSMVVLRSGATPMTANWNMGSNRITNLADGTASTDAATVGQLGKYLPLSGGTLTGLLNINGSNYTTTNTKSGTLYFGSPVGSKINGYQINNPDVEATSDQTYLFDMWMEVNPGVKTYGVLRAWTWLGERRWTFGEDGGITSNIKGDVAWKSDLSGYATTSALTTGLAGKQDTGDYALNSRVSAYFSGAGSNAAITNLQGVNWTSANTSAYVQVTANGVSLAVPTNDNVSQQITNYAQPKGNYQAAGDYVTSDTYNSDFSTSDVRVTNLPYNQREVSFNVQITSQGQYVRFPEAFADVPVSVIVCDNGNGETTDAWPCCARQASWTEAGCNVYIGSGHVPRQVSIVAKGSR